MKRDTPLNIYEKDPALFKEAIETSERETGFPASMIEKDYFCTLVLDHLGATGRNGLAFKGGTCLAKVHADFYRLSEDLDFTIPMASGASSQMRSDAFDPVRAAIQSLTEKYPSFHIEELRGADRSRQYFTYLTYPSRYGRGEGKIKIEVGLREPLRDALIQGAAKTLLLNPFLKTALFRPISMPCMSLRESMAEKFRAALTRREVAIRDFYDIGFVVESLGWDHLDEEFLNMVRQKLAVPRNPTPDVSDARLIDLKAQMETQLKPVLRSRDFDVFDLEKAVDLVRQVANALEVVDTLPSP